MSRRAAGGALKGKQVKDLCGPAAVNDEPASYVPLGDREGEAKVCVSRKTCMK